MVELTTQDANIQAEDGIPSESITHDAFGLGFEQSLDVIRSHTRGVEYNASIQCGSWLWFSRS